jgi:arginyl-tRNA synthetase
MQWGGDANSLATADLTPLTTAHESELLRALADYPEAVAVAARELAPHLVCNYLTDLAAKLHGYYNAERFLVEDDDVKRARLALIVATRQVLRNGLALIGVSAPEKM